MLTGIRHSVSACQAKPSRPIVSEDFLYSRTYSNWFSCAIVISRRSTSNSYNFLRDANDLTPSRYEFRFKDYAPWVFRYLREAFKIDAADYLVVFAKVNLSNRHRSLLLEDMHCPNCSLLGKVDLFSIFRKTSDILLRRSAVLSTDIWERFWLIITNICVEMLTHFWRGFMAFIVWESRMSKGYIS